MNKLFFTITSIIGVVLVGMFLTYPAYVSYRNAINNLEYQQNLIIEKEAYLAELNNIYSQLQSNEDKLSKIDSALPDEVSLPDIYNYLLTTVSEAGLTYDDISVLGMEEGQEIFSPSNGSVFVDQGALEAKETAITLTTIGTYQEFKNLLGIIQSSSRLFKIQEVKIDLEGLNLLGSGIEGGVSVVTENQEFSFILELIVFSY